MAEITVNEYASAPLVREAVEDVGGTIKWRVYTDGVLSSETDATAEQIAVHATQLEFTARGLREEKGRNLRPWLKNVHDNWDGLTNAQKFDRLKRLFDELLDIGIEQGWFD